MHSYLVSSPCYVTSICIPTSYVSLYGYTKERHGQATRRLFNRRVQTLLGKLCTEMTGRSSLGHQYFRSTKHDYRAWTPKNNRVERHSRNNDPDTHINGEEKPGSGAFLGLYGVEMSSILQCRSIATLCWRFSRDLNVDPTSSQQ